METLRSTDKENQPTDLWGSKGKVALVAAASKGPLADEAVKREGGLYCHPFAATVLKVSKTLPHAFTPKPDAYTPPIIADDAKNVRAVLETVTHFWHRPYRHPE